METRRLSQTCPNMVHENLNVYHYFIYCLVYHDVEQLFVHPYTKIEYISNSLNVERKAASRYLKTLKAIDVLKLEQVGKENIYINERLYKSLRQNY